MSEPVKQAFGIVIRKDGTVPFDDDVPDGHRRLMIEHLQESGHTLTEVPGTRHMKIAIWPPK